MFLAVKSASKFKLYDDNGKFIMNLEFLNSIDIFRCEGDYYITLYSEVIDPEFLQLYYSGKINDNNFKTECETDYEFNLGEVNENHYKVVGNLTLVDNSGQERNGKIIVDDITFGNFNGTDKIFEFSSINISEYKNYIRCHSKINFKIDK